MALRYCVPTSFPCFIPSAMYSPQWNRIKRRIHFIFVTTKLGSCSLKNSCNSRFNGVCFGSYTVWSTTTCHETNQSQKWLQIANNPTYPLVPLLYGLHSNNTHSILSTHLHHYHHHFQVTIHMGSTHLGTCLSGTYFLVRGIGSVSTCISNLSRIDIIDFPKTTFCALSD